MSKEKLLTCKQCGKKYKRLKREYCGDNDAPPITCADCGEPLTDAEVTDYYDNIEDDDDKPYCNGCISKMEATESAVDDSLMEGE